MYVKPEIISISYEELQQQIVAAACSWSYNPDKCDPYNSSGHGNYPPR